MDVIARKEEADWGMSLRVWEQVWSRVLAFEALLLRIRSRASVNGERQEVVEHLAG